jgi:hypothetical protein
MGIRAPKGCGYREFIGNAFPEFVYRDNNRGLLSGSYSPMKFMLQFIDRED